MFKLTLADSLMTPHTLLPMKSNRLTTPVLCLLSVSALLFSACGSTKTSVNSSHTTGEELIDLQKAYDQGIITEREYEKKKKDILDL